MPELIRALAFVKKAAARANAELGVLDASAPARSSLACDELIAGELHDQFVVDVIQGGAGTSTNMNANEVIANRALEHLGHRARARYDVLHPNDHVNASQSTNDVYPDGAAAGGLVRHRAAARRDGRPARRVRGQGGGVQRRAEDRPHAAAGRRADDARPGVPAPTRS